MITALKYYGKTFGNDDHAPKYSVKARPWGFSSYIEVTIRYAEPAAGRGIGTAQGAVRWLTLVLPAEAWDAIAQQVALASVSGATFQIDLDEDQIRTKLPGDQVTSP